MPIEDAHRWNNRYHNENRGASECPRSLLVESAHLLPVTGLALDVAMGMGGNSSYLIQRGLHVVGVDISWVAVHDAKSRLPGLMAVVADLTRFYLPPCSFDIIINFLYLQRDMWPQFIKALRPGGLLVIETLTTMMLSIHPDIDPQYLLKPGELREAFGVLDILVYREDWIAERETHPKAVASLIGRMPD